MKKNALRLITLVLLAISLAVLFVSCFLSLVDVSLEGVKFYGDWYDNVVKNDQEIYYKRVKENLDHYKYLSIQSVSLMLSSAFGIVLCGIKIYDLAKDLRGSVDKEAKADAKRKKLQAKLDQLSGEKTE